MSNKYENLSKEELLKLVDKQEEELKSKKYGLVWDSEREPEQVVLDCENNLPVLKRVKGKEIQTCDEDDNILIEGDNYHALTVLNYTHKEKIDVIYIDPPYNTGNKDFIYNDKYIDKEDGFRHSKWLNFMEKRLKLAKDLLKETGVIFISIDDNEMAQLRMLGDIIFGESNFIGQFVKQSKVGGGSDSKFIVKEHEYALVYAKNINEAKEFFVEHNIDYLKRYKEEDEKGRYFWDTFARPGLRNPINYDVVAPDGSIINGDWIRSKKRFEEDLKNGEIRFLKKKNKNWSVQFKQRLNLEGKKPRSMTNDFGGTIEGKNDLFEIFGQDKIFSYPKSVQYIKILLGLISDKNVLILDFMAGSGTTGHAVLDLNKEDSGNRKFILCTNNELNGLAKELREKGMSEKEIKEHGICRRVTYPRLEKVINGYKNPKGEKVEGLGGNLQYFRTDFVKKTENKDQVRLSLTGKCTEMLCVKENIFNLEKESENYKIFSSNKKDKFLCIYFNFIENEIPEFLVELEKRKERKAIYMFSVDKEVDKSIFKGIDNFSIEAIPEGILEEYKKLNKMNISIDKDLIYLDFNKAKKVIFEQGEKNDGAILLRIVLEKTIRKIAQIKGVALLKASGRDEKVAILNDHLKNQEIISKVDWEENKTYLAIGNHAAHGEYKEYNLDKVKNFHKHIQSLFNKFNF